MLSSQGFIVTTLTTYVTYPTVMITMYINCALFWLLEGVPYMKLCGGLVETVRVQPAVLCSENHVVIDTTAMINS